MAKGEGVKRVTEMARGRKPRFWVKIDCYGVLHGSINWLLTLDEQAIWIKLIAYSEICGGPPGFVQDNEGNGLPHEYLAHELHCPTDVFKSMLEKMERDNAIRVNGTGAIELVNFPQYQFTEYDRQRPYRERRRLEHKAEEYWYCPECHYTLERGKVTKNITHCPQCRKKGKDVALEVRKNE